MDANVVGMPLGSRWNEIGTRELPTLSLSIYRDQIDRLEQSQVAWTPYLEGAFFATLSVIYFLGIDIWTTNMPLISWKRVELHLSSRVMRQFGSVQSLDVDPVPQDFERTDGRGRAGTDWLIYHHLFIALWNDRREYITPIHPPEGDGMRELMSYLSWYRSWASLFLVMPSATAPDTYQQTAAEHKLLMDYYVQSSSLLGPLYGGSGRNASGLQLATDSVVELSERLRQLVYIDPTRYPLRGDVGASSSRQPADDSDDDDFRDPPPRSHRERRPPARHTPGSDAIPRQRRRRKDINDLQNMEIALKKAAAKGSKAEQKAKKKKVEDDISQLMSQMKARHTEELASLGYKNDDAASKGNLDNIVMAMTGISVANPGEPTKPSKGAKRREKRAQQEAEREQRIHEEQSKIISDRMIENEKLEEKLVPLGLTINEIKPDGHCLYRAVEDQLTLHPNENQPYSYQELRKIAAAYMREHAADFLPFFLSDGKIEIDSNDLPMEIFHKYCEEVESTAAWGGQLELDALTHCLKKHIIIFSGSFPDVEMGKEYKKESQSQSIMLSYHKHAYGLGEHYNSVVPTHFK